MVTGEVTDTGEVIDNTGEVMDNTGEVMDAGEVMVTSEAMDTGEVIDAGEVMDTSKEKDAGEVMDAGEGESGQTNAPNSEAPVFLSKGSLQVVQWGQRAPGIPSWHNWYFGAYHKPARCVEVVTSPRITARAASFTQHSRWLPNSHLKPCSFSCPNFCQASTVARMMVATLCRQVG